jgi:hypothetical protein
MSRWSGRNEANAVVTTLQFRDYRESGTGRVRGDRPRVEGGVGVLINVATTGVAKGTKFIEIATVVNASEFGARGAVGGNNNKVAAEMKVGDASHGRPETIGSFRMPGVLVA